MASSSNNNSQQSQLISLPHEVQLHLIEYLELNDLRSFSETSQEGNAIATSFLKGQFDNACKTIVPQESANYRLAGTECIHRLARLDSNAASRLLLPPEERSHHHHRAASAAAAASSRNPHGPSAAALLRARARQAARNTAETALRQLSDGLAAVHEQRRQAACFFWSHCGAAAVMVVVMAGRLFYLRLATALIAQAQWYEWHDLSRLAVGTLFAITVAVSVSKQQQRRAKRLEQQTKINRKNKSSMKRSFSVAADLSSHHHSHAVLQNDSLHRSRSAESLLWLVTRNNHQLSVSTPNLDQLLLLSSSRDDGAHCLGGEEPEESLWHVHEDDESSLSSQRKDPLQQRQHCCNNDDDKIPSFVPHPPNKKQKRTNPMIMLTKRPQEEVAPKEEATTTTVHTRPTGCVGAFQRAVADAKDQVADIVKEQRKQAFDSLASDQERADLSTAFIDACTDNGSLDVARIMAHRLPLDEFYVGSDGTESCALHTAAFHGACDTLDFLCRGCSYDTTNTTSGGGDGGLL